MRFAENLPAFVTLSLTRIPLHVDSDTLPHPPPTAQPKNVIHPKADPGFKVQGQLYHLIVTLTTDSDVNSEAKSIFV